MQSVSKVPLKSCLKVKGAPKRSLPPLSFHDKAQVILPDASRTTEPVRWEPNHKRKYKEDKHPGHDSDDEEEDSWGLGSNDLTVDVSKFLTKSIYDSSSEEEESSQPPSRPTSPTSKSPKSNKKGSSESKKAEKERKRSKGKKPPLKRTKSVQWGKRSLQVHCSPKELVGQVPRVALPAPERFPLQSSESGHHWKKLLVEGFVHFCLDVNDAGDPSGEVLPCRFTLCGNGVIDCFQSSETEVRTEFQYTTSLLPLFLSDNNTWQERTGAIQSQSFSPSTMLCVDYFSCPRSDEMIEDTWEAPVLARRENGLIIFATSSEKNKCLSILESFFIDSPHGTVESRPRLRNARQNSIRNLGKIFRSKSKEGRTNSVPFPGVALHVEPPGRQLQRGGSLPQALPTTSGSE